MQEENPLIYMKEILRMKITILFKCITRRFYPHLTSCWKSGSCLLLLCSCQHRTLTNCMFMVSSALKTTLCDMTYTVFKVMVYPNK